MKRGRVTLFGEGGSGDRECAIYDVPLNVTLVFTDNRKSFRCYLCEKTAFRDLVQLIQIRKLQSKVCSWIESNKDLDDDSKTIISNAIMAKRYDISKIPFDKLGELGEFGLATRPVY